MEFYVRKNPETDSGFFLLHNIKENKTMSNYKALTFFTIHLRDIMLESH